MTARTDVLAMTRDDIAAVMERVPALNAHGIGTFDGFRGKSREEREAIFRKDRDALLASEEACARVCRWLGDKAKTKSMNRLHSSYGLKHLAEEEVGYVSNGAFIAAAVHCGFPYQLVPGSPNGHRPKTGPEAWCTNLTRCDANLSPPDGRLALENPGLPASSVRTTTTEQCQVANHPSWDGPPECPLRHLEEVSDHRFREMTRP